MFGGCSPLCSTPTTPNRTPLIHACFCLHPQSAAERASPRRPSPLPLPLSSPLPLTAKLAHRSFSPSPVAICNMTHLRRDPVTPSRDGGSRHTGPHSALPLRLLLSLQHFPPLCKRASALGREGGRGSGVAAGSKKGPALSEPRAKCRRYSNQALWVRPNCLRVLLTPSAPQMSTKDKRQHKCEPRDWRR